MKRNREITFAVSEAEESAMRSIYGTGKAAAARMRNTLLVPKDPHFALKTEELLGVLEDIRRELSAIGSRLKEFDESDPAQLAIVSTMLLTVYKKLKAYARKTIPPK